MHTSQMYRHFQYDNTFSENSIVENDPDCATERFQFWFHNLVFLVFTGRNEVGPR